MSIEPRDALPNDDGFSIIISELEKQLQNINNVTNQTILKPKDIGQDANGAFFMIRKIKYRFVKCNSIENIIKIGSKKHDVPGILFCADNFNPSDLKLTDRFVTMCIVNDDHLFKELINVPDTKDPNKKREFCMNINIPKSGMTSIKNKDTMSFGPDNDSLFTVIKCLRYALDFLSLSSYTSYNDISKNLSGQLISNFAAYIEMKYNMLIPLKHKENGFDFLLPNHSFQCSNQANDLKFQGTKYSPKTDVLISSDNFSIDKERGTFMLLRLNLDLDTPADSKSSKIPTHKDHYIKYSNPKRRKDKYWGLMRVITFYDVKSLYRIDGRDEFDYIYNLVLSVLIYDVA